MKYIVQIGDEEIEVEAIRSGETCSFKLNGKRIDLDIAELLAEGSRSILASGKSFEAEVAELPEGLLVHLGGHHTLCRVEEKRKARLAHLAGEEEEEGKKILHAQMPGLVVQMLVSEGQEVKSGQGVLIVEAMKMQNELKAPVDGIVEEIRVKEGQPVEKDQVLMTFA
jgi:biotin carboxyl carrier protein